jgi:hypothetical protein
VALSPFAILFSATAFTDPLMVALGLGTCVAAARGRSGWAGLLAGLAFATKQTGLAWLPLAAVLQISNLKSHISKRSNLPSVIGHWSLAIGHWTLDIGRWSLVIGHWSLVIFFLLVALLMFGWDGVRVAQGAESFWCMGVTGYGGLRLIWPQELWTRLRGWIGLVRYLFVSPVVSGVLLVGSVLLVRRTIINRRYVRGPIADLLLVSFVLIYFLLHWLWAFPIWDRYLLPLVPVLAVLLGRILSLLVTCLPLAVHNSQFTTRSPLFVIRHWSLDIGHWSLDIGHWSLDIGHWSFVICHLSLVFLLIFPAWNAAHSRYPVGGDHGAYDGVDEVAAFLRDLPEGTVVYQHWLGWHYDVYLFDAPVYLAYWPTPAWLAQDVQVFGARESRYIAFPSWESSARVEWALAGVGYQLAPVLTTTRRDGTHSFTVYHVQPLSDP